MILHIYKKQGSEIFKKVIHPDDYERRLKNLEKCKGLYNEEEIEVEVRLRVVNKEWQWFRVTDKVFEREEDGTVSKVIGTAHNIHSQKISKEQLKEEQRRFKNAQAIGHIGSFERELPGDMVTYSEEFYNILGLVPKQDKIDLQEFMSHVHPDDRGTYQAAINHTHATGEPLDLVNRVVRSDGSTRYVHRRAAIMYKDGKPSKVYGTVQDVTDRIIAEEEKNRLEWLMRSTEMIAGTGSYEANLATNEIYFSEGLYRLLDVEPGEVELTLEWLNGLSHPEDAAKVQRIMEIAAETKKPYTYTRRIYRKDGELRVLEAQGKVITDREGRNLKFIGLVQDITDRKKAEQELLKLKDQLAKRVNESEDRFASLVTATSDTVYKMSGDWETMYTLQGRNFLSDTAGANPSWIEDYIPKPERPKVINAIRQAIEKKTMFELEHQVYDVEKNIGWTHSRAIPNYNDEGEIVEWLGVASDITARKKAEERQAYLLHLSDGLRALEDPEEILFRSATLLGEYLGAARVGYAEAMGEEKTLVVSRNYTNGVLGIEGNYSYKDYDAELLEELSAGRTVVREDIHDNQNQAIKEKDVHDVLKMTATVNVPLIKKEKLLSLLFIHFDKAHHFSEDEITLIEETADRTWTAAERARAEQALRQAQESLSIALEAAQMGTWILDLKNSTSKRNFRHDQIFGYNDPQPHWNIEIAKRHVLPEDHLIFDRAFANALRTGELQFEVRVRWQDGSIHWLAANGHFYFDENGEPVRAAGVNFEVTERRQAEEALRESEQRFRNLVEASALAVWETDPDGYVVVDSPSWRKFTGQTFEEWIGTGWINAVHPEDREGAITNWKEAVNSRKNFDYEFRMRSAEGNYRWTNIKAIPILDTDGRVTKWTGMNLDINSQKEAEKDLIKAKEEAEAASRAKEDFVSTMSHEIRTPLNAIIGLTNLLIEQKPRDDQKENLSSLSFSAKNLLALINDILDFSKLEAGKMELAENQFNLPDLLFNLQKAHQPQAIANGTELILHLEEKIPQIIATDQVKLSQILHNLVSNAVKFTRNGQVKISVELARQDQDLLWLNFAVKDTGIGIAADKAEHIFDKFAQAESSTVRNYGGTGLGLSITKLLLELLGSEIKLESRLGEGSSFYFTLPVKVGNREIAPVEIEEISEEKRNLSHMRLLLVEDVEINRKIIMQFLQNWWLLKPDEAANGKEAVEKATNHQYDLILMDVRMPEMDGYEVTERIRKLPGYKETPILALTADKNQEVQQALHVTQFSDMLTKPFEPRDLKRRILQHLSILDRDLLEPKKYSSIDEESNDRLEEIPEKDNNLIHEPSEESEEIFNEPSFNIERYEKISGGNREVLKKLITNALKAMENYKREFATAANEKDLKSLSDLVHKNTTSIYYVQANQLSNKISEYREVLKNAGSEGDEVEELITSILLEYDKVIEGLKAYQEKTN